jgi:polyisoprenoid-binding protein YceI
MKTTLIGFTSLFAAAVLISCGGKKNTVETKDKQDVAQVTPLTKTFAVDVQNSTLGWTGKKVSGQHTGTIAIKSGTIGVENDMIKAGNFVIDMNAIKNTDLTDATANGKLVGHLGSADFFDVAKYPESKFEITGAEKLAQADSLGNNYKIMGNLTIKETTKNITIPAAVTMDSTRFSAVSKFSIDRTEWNVQYGSGKFFKGLGDKMINDAIEFDLNLNAIPQK